MTKRQFIPQLSFEKLKEISLEDLCKMEFYQVYAIKKAHEKELHQNKRILEKIDKALDRIKGDDVSELFMKRLKILQKESGYKIEDLAGLLGLNINTYKSYANKGIVPPTETLCRIADFFKVSTDFLLGRSEYRSVGNDLIGLETGLSNKSIEILRYINHLEIPDNTWLCDDYIGHNKLTIEAINDLLEASSQEIERHKKENDDSDIIFTPFTYIAEYLHTDRSKVEGLPEYDGLQFIPFNDGLMEFQTDAKELYKKYVEDKIMKALDNVSEKISGKEKHGKHKGENK